MLGFGRRCEGFFTDLCDYIHVINICFFPPTIDGEVFKVKKSTHSKKIVKLLKKEYKDDLEKVRPRSELHFGLDGKGGRMRFAIHMLYL